MRILIAIAAACAAGSVLAEDLVTTKGVTYRNARVSEVEADGITFFHAGGVAKVPFTELSPELQKKHGYDPRRAAQAAAADAAQQARNAEQGKREALLAQIKQLEADMAHANAVAEYERKRIAASAMTGGSSFNETEQERQAKTQARAENVARQKKLKELREEVAIYRGQ